MFGDVDPILIDIGLYIGGYIHGSTLIYDARSLVLDGHTIPYDFQRYKVNLR